MEDHVRPIGLVFITMSELFLFNQKEERVLVTACQCGENLLKSTEGNINSQMTSSSVVCCV